METLLIGGTNGNRYVDRKTSSTKYGKRNGKLRAAGYRKPEPTGASRVSRVTLKDPSKVPAEVRVYSAAEIAAFSTK